MLKKLRKSKQYGMAIFVQIQLVSHVLTEIVDTPLLNSSLEKRQIPGSIIHLMKKHTSMVPKSTPGAEIKSMASVCLISSCSSFFMVLFRTFRKFLSTFASFLDDMSHQNLPQLIGYSPPTAGVTWGHFPILLLRQSSYDIWRTFLSGPKDCGILWKGLPISFCIPLLELFWSENLPALPIKLGFKTMVSGEDVQLFHHESKQKSIESMDWLKAIHWFGKSTKF